MKKFRFSLQTVHDLRETRRDEEERTLALTANAAQEAADQLAETRQAHSRATDVYAARLQSGEIDPFDATLSVNYLASLLKREREDQTRLRDRERVHEAQRTITAEAARAAEATAKLRERQRERHKLESSRAEQEMLDEMATLLQARLTREKSA
jgi:flagellar export protein FliJ